MVRIINLSSSGNDDTANKLLKILDGISIKGFKITVNGNAYDICIEILSGNVRAPTIETSEALGSDLCHSARSQLIPCIFNPVNDVDKIKVTVPTLPEFDLSGNGPTMCLEMEIKFLETLISRIINLKFIDRSSSP